MPELALCPDCGTLVGRGGCDDCGRTEAELTYRSGDTLREFLQNQQSDDSGRDYLNDDFDYVTRRVDQPAHGEAFDCRYCDQSFDACEADDLVEHVLDSHARETLSTRGPFDASRRDRRRRADGLCLSCGAQVEMTLARPCDQVRISCSRSGCHGYYLAASIRTSVTAEHCGRNSRDARTDGGHPPDGDADDDGSDDELVECDDCGARGLPERIDEHDCPRRRLPSDGISDPVVEP